MKEYMSEVREYQARALYVDGHFEGLVHSEGLLYLHLPNLCLLLNSRVYLSLCLASSSTPGCTYPYVHPLSTFFYPRTIWSLLKFHPTHRLIIICVIDTRNLKVCLFSQVYVGLLKY